MKYINGFLDENYRGVEYSHFPLPFKLANIEISKVLSVKIKKGMLTIVYVELLNFPFDYSRFEATGKFIAHYIIDATSVDNKKFMSQGMMWDSKGLPGIFDNHEDALFSVMSFLSTNQDRKDGIIYSATSGNSFTKKFIRNQDDLAS